MWKLTHKGKYVKIHGSPEYRVYNITDPKEGIILEIILQELGIVGKDGYDICLKEGYLEYNKELNKVFRKKEFSNDLISIYLNEVENGFILSKNIMSMLKKRDLIKNYIIS